MNSTPLCRVRFAPSPTGFPHVGNFRTALYNYLFARHSGGAFLIRIEDTDKERSRKEYEEAIFESLRWMGLDRDEPPYYQSAQLPRHQREARRLLDEGKAYRCRCAPDELEARRARQMAEGKNPMYDGCCRDMNYPDDGTPFCIRIKSPLEGVTRIYDPIRGEVVFDNTELDDLILIRTDGTPTFNFAVVADDFDMKITHVIRGDDHLNNTARQVGIFQALRYPLPVFAHLPQILGQDRTRLSKRHGATGVLEYREQGYLPEALMNYLARLGWSHGDQEIFTKEELIQHFSLENVNKSPAVFDPQKLIWLNGEHIRAMQKPWLTDHFIDFVRRKNYLPNATTENRELFTAIVEATQIRAKTLDEMFQKVEFLFVDSLTYPEKEVQKIFKPEILPALEDLADFAAGKEINPTHEEWEAEFGRILERRGLKMKVLASAVRLALTGTNVSPPIFHVLDLLGLTKVEKRLRHTVEWVKTVTQA